MTSNQEKIAGTVILLLIGFGGYHYDKNEDRK